MNISPSFRQQVRNNRQGRSGDDFGSNKNPLSRRAKMLIQNYVDLIRFRCWKMRKGEGESEELARNAAKCFYYSSLSGETRGNARTKANVYGVFISCTWRRRVASRRRETRRERFDTSQGFIRFRIFLFLLFLSFLSPPWKNVRRVASIGFWISISPRGKGLCLFLSYISFHRISNRPLENMENEVADELFYRTS